MNKDNLIPGAHKLTREENSLGGINSAISRKAKKRALEIARDILSMPVDDGSPTDVSEISSLEDASQVTLDVMTAILANLANKAIKGDLRACRDLLTISGDYVPRQEMKLDTEKDYDDIDFTIVIGAPDQSEATFFDRDGNKIRTIYGDEAMDLYFKMVRAGEIEQKPGKIDLEEEHDGLIPVKVVLK